ncbi:Rv0909 family putative TA system antitoxin [Microbacterium halophytorum]|uniref:Rv0909 family putative TA system antitoxin n=1 Tax=Microbacterium halophytorum TaxID=2067568 RepID=UPI000CFAA7AC|nr:Rv0909 family putative TA system antitoxin [Microbacterium halophytorum]
MGIEDLAASAKDALASDKGEEISDQVLDGAEGLANKVTGNNFADNIEAAKNAADDFLGKQ